MMDVPLPENTAEENVCCPTCKARQPWSDTCRRCKCDLTLLRSVQRDWRRTRRSSLAHLSGGRTAEALRQAQRAYGLRADGPSAKLLAVCLFWNGVFDEAIRMANVVEEESSEASPNTGELQPI